MSYFRGLFRFLLEISLCGTRFLIILSCLLLPTIEIRCPKWFNSPVSLWSPPRSPSSSLLSSGSSTESTALSGRSFLCRQFSRFYRYFVAIPNKLNDFWCSYQGWSSTSLARGQAFPDSKRGRPRTLSQNVGRTSLCTVFARFWTNKELWRFFSWCAFTFYFAKILENLVLVASL